MKNHQEPVWKIKTLCDMNRDEWESLCDGCGICCLEKIEDVDTGTIRLTSVTCEHYDNEGSCCTIYETRFRINSDCIQLTPHEIQKLVWLPETCAYLCILNGQDLEWWHPLISGEPNTVHQAGISVRGKSISGKHIHPKDLKNYLRD